MDPSLSLAGIREAISEHEDRCTTDGAWSACIESREDDGVVTLRANSCGLPYLARHLVEMASERATDGSHLHLDKALNDLEGDGPDLILQKIIDPWPQVADPPQAE